MKILVVDTDRDLVEMLTSWLKRWDMRSTGPIQESVQSSSGRNGSQTSSCWTRPWGMWMR
jgi:hypothetical protein